MTMLHRPKTARSRIGDRSPKSVTWPQPSSHDHAPPTEDRPLTDPLTVIHGRDGVCPRAVPSPFLGARPFGSERRLAFTDCSAKSVIRCCAAVETLLRASTSQRLLSQRLALAGQRPQSRGAPSQSRIVVAARRRRARRPRSLRSTRPASAAAASRDARSKASATRGASAAAS